jgi:hypothetical protein
MSRRRRISLISRRAALMAAIVKGGTVVFAFSNPYEITVEASGEKVTYRVSRGGHRP